MAKRKTTKSTGTKGAKKSARSRRSSRQADTARFQLFSPTNLVNDLLQGNFKNLARELKHLESQLRGMADAKTRDIRAQLLVVRKEVTARLRVALRKDLKVLQSRIRDLAVQVGKLESLLMK